MRVWLGGATGFLGSHVAEKLLAAGHDLVATSRRGGVLPTGYRVGSVDMLDTAAVEDSARGSSHAILCAGRVSRSPDEAELLHQLHVGGTRAVLRGLRAAGVCRVVYVSTSGTLAVSRDPKRIDDEQSGAPLEHIASFPYYRSKYYGEKEALALSAANFSVVVVNPSLLLGPSDLRESSTSDVRRFLEGALAMTPAGGLAFVDVRDVADALVAALTVGRGGERYLLNAANMTFDAFFARLERISGVSAPRLRMPRNPELSVGLFSVYDQILRRLGGVPPVEKEDVALASLYWYCSTQKAERELGFSPRDPGETLRDTVLDLVARKVVAPKSLRHVQELDV